MLASKDIGHTEGCVRRLKLKDDLILWSHWIDAYNWDVDTNVANLKVYHRLQREHIDPDSCQKMRNELALGVLNEEMYHLMKVSVITICAITICIEIPRVCFKKILSLSPRTQNKQLHIISAEIWLHRCSSHDHSRNEHISSYSKL